jgi:hypothetical protein
MNKATNHQPVRMDNPNLRVPSVKELMTTRCRGPKRFLTSRARRVLCNFRMHPAVAKRLREDSESLGVSACALMEIVLSENLRTPEQVERLRDLLKSA